MPSSLSPTAPQAVRENERLEGEQIPVAPGQCFAIPQPVPWIELADHIGSNPIVEVHLPQRQLDGAIRSWDEQPTLAKPRGPQLVPVVNAVVPDGRSAAPAGEVLVYFFGEA